MNETLSQAIEVGDIAQNPERETLIVPVSDTPSAEVDEDREPEEEQSSPQSQPKEKRRRWGMPAAVGLVCIAMLGGFSMLGNGRQVGPVLAEASTQAATPSTEGQASPDTTPDSTPQTTPASAPDHWTLFHQDAQSYVVKAGDELWAIAGQLGILNNHKWDWIHEVAKLNPGIGVFEKNGVVVYIIYPGQVLKFPAVN